MPNRIIGDKFISPILCFLSNLALALALGGDRRIAAKASGSALIEAAVQSIPASSVQSQAGPCESQPIYKQFDFWVGEWDVTAEGRKVGDSSIQRIVGGCVIYENYEQPDGYLGKSFNFFDAHLGKWRQTWVDAGGNTSEFAGKYKDGAMRYDGETHRQNGAKVLRRMIVYDLGSDRVRQYSERSTDGGKTWGVAYDFIYVRKNGRPTDESQNFYRRLRLGSRR